MMAVDEVISHSSNVRKVDPLCAIFDQCGGCAYQNISYRDELKIKEDALKGLLDEHIPGVSERCQSIVASPKEYYYRNRIDLKLVQTKAREVFIGFAPKEGRGVIAIETCPIANEAICQMIPTLTEKAKAKLTPKYRQANIEIKTGDDGRVYWGGIGRRSLRLYSTDYLWTDILGKRIFYSLDTFFQANLSILPLVIERIKALSIFDSSTTFYDIYGGVGLFGVSFADGVKRVVLIEDNPASIELARFNRDFHKFVHFEIWQSRAEEKLEECLKMDQGSQVVMVDPPRGGLSETVCETLTRAKSVKHVLYLSCNSQTLVRDLKKFISSGWQIHEVVPFDFFPKTKLLETLVVMKSNG